MLSNAQSICDPGSIPKKSFVYLHVDVSWKFVDSVDMEEILLLP